MIPLILTRKFIYRLLYLVDLALGNRPKVFVLCYHSISNDWLYAVRFSEFKKQINYLQKFCHFITPQDLANYIQGKGGLPFPSVLLTFDDGYEDIFIVKNFLAKKKITPILFLLSGDKNIDRKELATQKKLLNKKQILELKKLGWEIGSHGATHSNFWALDQSGINAEIRDSKKDLEKIFGEKIKYFAYPKGRYNDKILKMVSSCKYNLAFSMDDRFITRETNRLAIPRVGLNQTHSFEEFVSLFSPSVIRFRQACKKVKLERAFS